MAKEFFRSRQTIHLNNEMMGDDGSTAMGACDEIQATPMGDDGSTATRACDEIQASEAAAQCCESCDYDCGGGLRACPA